MALSFSELHADYHTRHIGLHDMIHGRDNFVHNHKKEAGLLVTGIFAVLAVAGFIFWMDPQDLHKVEHWAEQPWEERICTVEEVGVSYRGSCDISDFRSMTKYKNFAECMGPSDMTEDLDQVQDAYKKTPPGLCAAQGDIGFNGGQLPPQGRSQGLLPAAETPLRRLIGRLPRPPTSMLCHHSYLVWAVLQVPNTTKLPGRPDVSSTRRCGYEYGATAASIVGNWGEVQHLLDELERAKGLDVRCWVLQDNDCVVSYHDQVGLTAKESTEHRMIRIVGTGCAILAAAAGFFTVFWYCEENLNPAPAGGYHSALPTTEQQAAISDRVTRILNVTGARFGDVTPASGDSSLRVSERNPKDHRTIEASGKRSAVAPRNMAQVFLHVDPTEP